MLPQLSTRSLSILISSLFCLRHIEDNSKLDTIAANEPVGIVEEFEVDCMAFSRCFKANNPKRGNYICRANNMAYFLEANDLFGRVWCEISPCGDFLGLKLSVKTVLETTDDTYRQSLLWSSGLGVPRRTSRTP